jgi:hypothetical protein
MQSDEERFGLTVAKWDNINMSYMMEYLPSEQGGAIWFP